MKDCCVSPSGAEQKKPYHHDTGQQYKGSSDTWFHFRAIQCLVVEVLQCWMDASKALFFKLKVVILLDLNGFGCVEKHKSFRLCSRNGPSKPIMWYFGIFPDLQMLLIPEICAT